MILWYITLAIMAVLNIIIWSRFTEPKLLTEIKQRYWETLEMLRQTGDPMWENVLRPAIITGMTGWNKTMGPIGSNVNKGYEIYICLDGDDVNSAMYILIHELAHMSVPEYDHTTNFWKNFQKLKTLCIQHGLYTSSGVRGYCGDTIRD